MTACAGGRLQAFNRWLEDDWGYAYKERIFAAPMITLIDVDAAVAELRRVLEADPRIVCIKGGRRTPQPVSSPPPIPVSIPSGPWSTKSGVTVGIHSGDAGYGRYLQRLGALSRFRSLPLLAPATVLGSDRHLSRRWRHSCARVFSTASRGCGGDIEAGAVACPVLIKNSRRRTARCPGRSNRTRSKGSRQHVGSLPSTRTTWPAERIHRNGTRAVRFRWPHAEGLAEPRIFALDLRRHGYSEDEVHTVMAENGWALARRTCP